MMFLKRGRIYLFLCLLSCHKQAMSSHDFASALVQNMNRNHIEDVLHQIPEKKILDSIMVCTQEGENNLLAAMQKAGEGVERKQRQFQETFPRVQIMTTNISKVQHVPRGQSQGDCIVSRDFDIVYINVLIQYSDRPVREVYLQLDTLYIDSRYYLLDIHDHDR